MCIKQNAVHSENTNADLMPLLKQLNVTKPALIILLKAFMLLYTKSRELVNGVQQS